MSRPSPSAPRPAPGDLYVFAETSGFPVEWAILEQKPGSEQWLAVPADTNPLTGSADVEALANEPGGPLSLRCRFALWLDATRFDPSRHTGALGPGAVARALARCAELETGEPAASPLAWEVDADPEYEDWVRDVLVPAHVALARPLIEEEPAPPVRTFPRRFTALGNPYALAASILLLVTLGLSGGLLWQRGEIADLAASRTRTEADLQKERQKHAETEAAHRKELAERDRQAAKRLQEDQDRIADLEKRLDTASRPRPLLNTPYTILYPNDPTRGSLDPILLPPGASHLLVILSVPKLRDFSTYRLEIVSKDTGRSVWSTAGLHRTALEVSVALPRDLLPTGDYRLRLYGLRGGKAEPAGEYEMGIADQ